MMSFPFFGVFFYSFLHPKKTSLQERIMKCYGYLFGFIELKKDTHHDEVFIERNGVVIIRNNQWLLTPKELREIGRELGLGKVTIIDYGDR